MESVGEFEYHTKDLIGHGAFAVVYKGRHKTKHDLVVAIKSITKKNLAKSQSLLGKEIKILRELAELHHENVVALLDCKETLHHVYLVMEYCNGGDLADYLNVKGTLSEDTIHLFLRQLAGAMKALNAKGIVHRDLKPQNILLCYSGKPSSLPSDITLKIADFGFARFLQDGVMAATLCGSPMYMAPEVIMSLQYDAKADLWSIGTIVFQCLTGKAPFQAQTPQALKQFYEKNCNLVPRIPVGTSTLLTDLLLRLLKRNAKDRMEFDEFFNHPFLRPINKLSLPVPVPNCYNAFTDSPPQNYTSTDSPFSKNVPTNWARDADLSNSNTTDDRLSNVDKSLPSFLEDQDFVIVPCCLPDDQPFDVNKTDKSASSQSSDNSEHLRLTNIQMQDENIIKYTSQYCLYIKCYKCAHRTSDAVYTGTNFTTIFEYSSKVPAINTLSNNGPEGNLVPHNTTYHNMKLSLRPDTLPTSLQCSKTPSSYPRSEPIPVPSQREAYDQIQRSLQDSESSLKSLGGKSQGVLDPQFQSPVCSPVTSKPPLLHSVSSISAKSNESIKVTNDVSNLIPPTVQFAIGTPPSVGKRRNSAPCMSRVQNPAWQQTTLVSGNPLSPILGSPTKELPKEDYNYNTMQNRTEAITNNVDLQKNAVNYSFHMTFAGRTAASPEVTDNNRRSVDNKDWILHRSGSSGKLKDVSGTSAILTSSPKNILPYHHYRSHYLLRGNWEYKYQPCGRIFHGTNCGAVIEPSPPSHSYLSFGTSPQKIDAHLFFVAPELPEETLLEKEHNETLAKLNFVLALVDCILDLAHSRSTPISALTDSYVRKEILLEQFSIISEGYRRAEQLVLYMRALHLLSSSLQLSREEVHAGRLQPSTSVKNVLQILKEHFHHCLTTCKSLNSQCILQATGIDPSSSNITADRLIYNYAIEMCQSAALEELFGNPEECFRRYQTAQILLHSLAQQVVFDDDKKLLEKYKIAVEKRLFVLQSQGYIYAYNTV